MPHFVNMQLLHAWMRDRLVHLRNEFLKCLFHNHWQNKRFDGRRPPLRVLFPGLSVVLILTGLANCATDDLAGLTTRDTSATDPTALANAEAAANSKSAIKDAAAEELLSGGRSLASTDGKLEQSFTKLMNSPQASDYLNQELNRVQVLHALSDGYLKAFDALLDADLVKAKAASTSDRVLENEPYAQLLASRRLLDETETRLSYFLYRALETKWSEDVRPDHKQSAVQLVAHFKYNIERRSEYFAQPAMQEIAQAFTLASEQARASYASQYSGEPTAGLARDLSGVLSAVRAAGSASVATAFAGAVKAAPPLPPEMVTQVSKDIAVLVKDIQANWKTEADERTAETSKVEPSAGAEGSIDGSDFKNATWALTFDDGPSIHDQAILNALQAHHMRATFFWVAQNVLEQSASVKAAQTMGMNLANHSFTNYDLGRSDTTLERIQHEVADAASVETKAFGFRPTLFRCPYGSCLQVDQVREALEAQKFVHVQWNIDGIDWKDHQADSVYARIKKEMTLQKHGIIVLRDTQPQAPIVAERLIQDFAQDKMARVVTVQEAIDETNRK